MLHIHTHRFIPTEYLSGFFFLLVFNSNAHVWWIYWDIIESCL